MHYLITNDDGIGAPGIAALERAIAQLPGATYTVVAPNQERSQCGHRITTHETLEIEQRGEHHFACSGSPADCVRLALFGLNLPIDRVVSGINAGGNMGQDLPISGTAAAAREATYHGIPAVAMSHYLIRGHVVQWDRIASWAHQLLLGTLDWKNLSEAEFFNVNFPHLKEYTDQVPTPILTTPTLAPLPASYEEVASAHGVRHFAYKGNYSQRAFEPGSDVGVCFGGQISLSRIQVL